MSAEPAQDCWNSYLDHFDYFTVDNIRPGNHPRAMVHPHPVKNSIVLVHGLSDSPYYMTALGDFFFKELGYNVFLPLLQGHGLRDPQGMENVQLEEWQRNVRFAIDAACATQTQVSVGGLSTGGALCYQMAAENSTITGALYLFSAALDLSDRNTFFRGNLKELALRSKRFVDLTERGRSLVQRVANVFNNNEETGSHLIGQNPYKYKYIDLDGAHQLAKLIQETDRITAGFNTDNRFVTPVFIAHSESDKTVDINAVKELALVCEHADTLFFARSLEIGHAEVVLNNDISPTDPGKEQNRNPEFLTMTARIKEFAQRNTILHS